MTPLISPREPADLTAARRAFAVIAFFTLVRLLFLEKSGLELYGDEAQYYVWSRSPALGYFTKPPLIAWLIAGTTALYGTGEFGVRLAAPLCHAIAAAALFGAGTRLFNMRTGAAAAVVWTLTPGVSFSSVIISTDGPMLMFAALALCGYAGLLKNPAGRGDIVLVGAALGLGLLSKLAMGYFILGLLVHASLDATARAVWRRPGPWIALALGLAIYAPNVIWNLSHDGATYGHLAENAGLAGKLFNPLKLAEFLAGQIGVFGPIPFGVLVACCVHRPWRRDPGILLCLSFAVPVLVIMSGQALASRAFANWAAFAYVGATLCAAKVLADRPRLAWSNIVLHTAVAAGLYAWGLGFIHPPVRHDPVAGLRGWRGLASEISREWDQSGVPTLISADRMDTARLMYYLPRFYGPIRSVSSDGLAHSEFDLSVPLDIESGRSGLLVSRFADLGPLAARFGSTELVSIVSVPRPRAATLKYYLFRVRDFDPGPADRQAASP